ncbi:MAG: metal ABC transporter substrate-binding protein [Lachnospiraceae bacterium]
MKKKKYLFVLYMLLAITLAGGIFTKIFINIEERNEHTERIQVVTSFYPVYIAVKNVVGDSETILLENLSEPQTGCMHDYQLTAQDMKLLSKADIFIINGGGIETFLAEVGKVYPNLEISETTKGLELQKEEGSENAHQWMDTRLYTQMVKNIADTLSRVDKKNASIYQENANIYCKKIENLTNQIDTLKTEFKNNVVIFHEAYAYIAEQFGWNVVYCLNLDEERQVSAGEIADMLAIITKNQVSMIFAEELYGKDMGETVEKETDSKVYYLDTLVRGNYETDSYLTAMQKNIDIIKQALEEM